MRKLLTKLAAKVRRLIVGNSARSTELHRFRTLRRQLAEQEILNAHRNLDPEAFGSATTFLSYNSTRSRSWLQTAAPPWTK